MFATGHGRAFMRSSRTGSCFDRLYWFHQSFTLAILRVGDSIFTGFGEGLTIRFSLRPGS
jgi:hypothetical protein